MDKDGMTLFSYEAYTITLKHTIFCAGEEKELELEEPLTIRYISDTTFRPTSILINEMMDKLKAELLKRYSE